MNRFKRGTSILDSNDDDEEKLYERQALIASDDEPICDSDASPSSGPLQRRNRSKNSLELGALRKTKDSINELNSEHTLYDIQPGDSLHSICLRYACPVNQVKRLNGLMTDQEFYGLKQLKLPLGKLGLLEDVLKSQSIGQASDLIEIHNESSNGSVVHQPRKFVNSPGSALSITHNNIRHKPQFKPLLSPGYSSDNINQPSSRYYEPPSNHDSRSDHFAEGYIHHNSHSFSSLREFDHHHNDTNYVEQQNFNMVISSSHQKSKELRDKAFIKPTTSLEESQITVDALLMDSQPIATNVFEDLDYQVKQAKAAAQSYDKRAAELADRIDITSDPVAENSGGGSKLRTSKIPELFFTGENFGLNLTKLIVLIFFICLVVPLVYMNQVTGAKRQL